MKILSTQKLLLVILLASACCSIGLPSFAQLTIPPNGGNKKASVSEKVGITDILINYDRPAVKSREGHIWGELVHYGFKDLGFGSSKSAPWRAGANENTTISFSTDVKIEGKDLAAGTYGFFLAMEEGGATAIFSKNATSWGSYFYDASEDALRVNIKTVKTDQSVERLKYEFTDQTDNSAVIVLLWEKLKIPFKVEIDYPKTQIALFKDELRGNKGFTWQALHEAASVIFRTNTNLEQALKWSDQSINEPFIGEKNFTTLSLKSQILNKLGKTEEASVAMKDALPLGNVQEIHEYGRELLSQKKGAEALKVFQLNAKKNPNQFTTNMGLARGYSATGDYKNALKYANLALPQSPDANNKSSVESMIKLLKEGKDVN